MSETFNTPVLVIGGGPVGLSLSLDLAWRGVKSILIEQGDGSVVHPKVGHISMRTMEHIRRWGLVPDVRNCGFPPDYVLRMVYCTSMNGYRLCSHEFPSMRDAKTPETTPEKKQRCPQLWFDPILMNALKRYDLATCLYETKLVSFSQDEFGVRAVVSDKSGERELAAQFMVGCDGANSSVRRALNISMEGNPVLSRSVAIYFRAPDLLSKTNQDEAERYTFVGPEGTWGNLTAVDACEFWRLTVYGSQATVDLALFDAEAWVRRCLDHEDLSFEILSVLPWRRSQLVAERYSQNRVFLAGDAAHTMSPTGGFGMNTGIGDAVDLAWKLDGFLKGWGCRSLLQSYNEERKPIGKRNVDFSAANYHNLTAPAGCADILEPSSVGEVSRSQIGGEIKASTIGEYNSAGVILGYRYEASPICIEDDAPIVPDLPDIYVPTSSPGARAPHVWLEFNQSILDLFGREFVLLRFSNVDVSEFAVAAELRKLPTRIVDIDNSEAARLYKFELVLVRPDGHVAWRGNSLPENIAYLLDKVRGC